MKKGLWSVLAAAMLWPLPLQAQTPYAMPDLELVPQRDFPKRGPEEIPFALRLIMQPIKRGMWLRLPVVDTDPNRGITGGFMPIWVLREDNGERIEQIHAPSITYNKYFGPVPTYRYYWYPESDSTLVLRGAVGKYEHEVLGEFQDYSFRGTEVDLAVRVQYNVDSGQRYFGFGPDTSKEDETNYKEDYIMYRVTAGLPWTPKNPWRVHLSDMLTADKVSDGPIGGLPSFNQTFPDAVLSGRKMVHADRLILDYDTRDHAVTTSRGAYFQAFAEYSANELGSYKDFGRYGLDGRYYHRWREDSSRVTAAQVQFEQLTGDAAFWLQPRLGGKYSLRAYGNGRYTDRGLLAANLEQRFTVYKMKMADVWTEFEVAPFAGVG
ncbi:MAG: BamA/TamA family outer membrane protein, partial [Elusimicrobia bacterium]|nr:BamA/TamA family outer membrane protein [Elusimicrobiota bacterium]